MTARGDQRLHEKGTERTAAGSVGLAIRRPSEESTRAEPRMSTTSSMGERLGRLPRCWGLGVEPVGYVVGEVVRIEHRLEGFPAGLTGHIQALSEPPAMGQFGPAIDDQAVGPARWALLRLRDHLVTSAQRIQSNTNGILGIRASATGTETP
jgi:hypothetical protein